MTDTTIDRARALLILRETVRCADAVSMCNQMGDTLAELLAEVERLTLAASEHRDGRLAALERATAAEAKLRELASAEPVAWLKKNGFRFIGEIEPSDYETEVPLYTVPPAPILPDDAELLSAMQENCWKVEPVNIPTGGDDYDIGWRVVEFHLPNVERVMAFSDNADPRTAIRAAMNVLAAAPGVPS